MVFGKKDIWKRAITIRKQYEEMEKKDDSVPNLEVQNNPISPEIQPETGTLLFSTFGPTLPFLQVNQSRSSSPLQG